MLCSERDYSDPKSDGGPAHPPSDPLFMRLTFAEPSFHRELE
jgi:hypothetical protein